MTVTPKFCRNDNPLLEICDKLQIQVNLPRAIKASWSTKKRVAQELNRDFNVLVVFIINSREVGVIFS
jgi:hypothetical protein